jgi:HAD superfamily hydrolase (TIGR01509 family)
MIKGIFFDAAGVLYGRSGPTESHAVFLLQQGGFATVVSPKQLERQQAMRSQASQGQISHNAYWDHYLTVRGVTNPEQRTSMVKQIIEFSNNVQPMEGASQALAGLKQRGFIVGIVTDTMYPLEWKMRRLEKAGVAEYIDVVACSSVLGVHKPDPAMYLNALEQAHLAASESAFVGHAAIEIDGARRAGMATVAVNYEPESKADYYCANILELLNVPIFQIKG